MHNQTKPMHPLGRWLGALTLLVLLGACGRQDPETTAEPEPPPDNPARMQRSAPAGAPPDPADSARRATDPDAATDAVRQARAERERLREGNIRERLHWDEDTLSEQLGLDSSQFQALQQARQTVLEQRVRVRTGLLAQRHFRERAEAGADGARLEEIETQTRQLRAQLDSAEQAWQEALRSILDADQLQRLAEQRPELLEPASGDR